MPIYEYACSACSHEFEELVRNGEVVACPQCGGAKLEETTQRNRLTYPGETRGPADIFGLPSF